MFGFMWSALAVIIQITALVFCWQRNLDSDRRNVFGHLPWVLLEMIQGCLWLYMTPEDTQFQCSSANQFLSFLNTIIFNLLPAFFAARTYVTVFHTDKTTLACLKACTLPDMDRLEKSQGRQGLLSSFFRGGYSELMEIGTKESWLIAKLWFECAMPFFMICLMIGWWPACTVNGKGWADGQQILQTTEIWDPGLVFGFDKQYVFTKLSDYFMGDDYEYKEQIIQAMPELALFRYMGWGIYGFCLVRCFRVVPNPDTSEYVIQFCMYFTLGAWLIYGNAAFSMMITLGGLLFPLSFIVAPFKPEQKLGMHIEQIDIGWKREADQNRLIREAMGDKYKRSELMDDTMFQTEEQKIASEKRRREEAERNAKIQNVKDGFNDEGGVVSTAPGAHNV